jgi:hypothetical protein
MARWNAIIDGPVSNLKVSDEAFVALATSTYGAVGIRPAGRSAYPRLPGHVIIRTHSFWGRSP